MATVEHLALGEELVAHGRELRALLGVGDVARLLRELAPHGRRHLLVIVDHPAGYAPLPHIPALDRNHLQPALVCGVPPCHHGICGMVAPPLAEQPSIGHACAAPRVERPVLLVEAELALIRDPRLPVLRPEPADLRVSPPARLRDAVVLDHSRVGVCNRRIRRPRHRPRDVLVGHRGPLRVGWVLAPSVCVQRCSHPRPETESGSKDARLSAAQIHSSGHVRGVHTRPRETEVRTQLVHLRGNSIENSSAAYPSQTCE